MEEAAGKALSSFHKGNMVGDEEVLRLNCESFLRSFFLSHDFGYRAKLAGSSHSGNPSFGMGVFSSVPLVQGQDGPIGSMSFAEVLASTR
jgi:hypothetical protein